MLHYNYILFNASDNKVKVDHNAYYTICVEDLYGHPGIKVVSFAMDECKNKLMYKLYRLHTSSRINRFIKLPFKHLWYPSFFKDEFNNNKPYCFIFISRDYSLDYFRYLKQSYNNCKIVLMHRDLLKVCNRIAPGLAHNSYLDLEMTFDKSESEKYGMIHFDEFESKIDVPISDNYPESDIFFAGKCKDRLPLLLTIYKKLSEKGYKCKYYLTNVPKEERIALEGIEYADEFMPYSEMLYHSVNSRCILEVNQSDADGYTSRFLEAVMFNKKLLTNNVAIKNSKFYNPQYIQLFETAEDIDPSFINNSDIVDYHYNGEFSPIRLISKIDNILCKETIIK